jgi:hypothetical protein
MTNSPLAKITAITAAEICANVDLQKPARQLLREGMNPREFVAALLDNKKYVDAIDFLAHALPVREGIWWGCLCMQHAMGNDLPAPDRAAATAAVLWVIEPTEETRAATKAPAEAAGPASPAGALAAAANLASAEAIARAVKLASIKTEAPKISKLQGSYVELAIEVAEGRLI